MDPEWIAQGRTLVARARRGELTDDDDLELAPDVAASIATWPDPWVAAELLTHDLDTGREIDVDCVLYVPHELELPVAAGDVAALVDEAFGTRDPQAQIAALEAAWRITRAPELADAIAALDATLPVAKPPSAKKKSDTEVAWMTFAATASPRDAFAGTWPVKWKDAQRRMRALYQRPRSPRLAAAAIAFANRDSLPYTSQASQTFWQSLAWFVAFQGDTRQLAALEKLERAVAEFVDKQGELVATAALRSFTPPALPASISKRIATRGVAPSKPAALSLATPEERAVAADQLQLAGDPRGEFITLQTTIAAGGATPELQKRERALFKKHVKAWCPSALDRDGCVFRGGVPVIGYITANTDAELRSFVGSRALATLEEVAIYGEGMGRITAKTMADVARSLPAVHTVFTNDATALELSKGPATAIARLVVDGNRAHAYDGPGLPKLRRLDAETIRPTWIGTPWFAKLAAVGCAEPGAWDELWRSGEVACPIVLYPRARDLHLESVRRWELAAIRDGEDVDIVATPLVGATAANLIEIMGVASFTGVRMLRVPENVIEKIAKTAAKKKIARVDATPAVDVAALGISVAIF